MKNYKDSTIKNTIIIIGIYIFSSMAWVFLSDKTLFLVFDDLALLESFQTIKGAIYILFTGILFYFIIKRRMDLYAQTINHLSQVVEALERSNKNLKRLESKLYQTAYYDELTNLPSKNLIKEEIEKHILENENEVLGFAYLDIDNFKDINEMLGHQYGDELLKEVAKNFTNVIGPKHLIGRLTGDEFIFVFKGFESKAEFLTYVKKIAGRFNNNYTFANSNFYITYSSGIAIYPYDGQSYEDLLQHADFALSVAKRDGKQRYVYYSDELKEHLTHQIEVSNALYNALRNKEFVVHFQPIVSSKDKLSLDVEALIRWNHPKKGLLYPGDFIDIAEKTSHITEMTLYVIEASFQQHLIWKKEGKDVCVSINLASRVLKDASFVIKVEKLIKTYKIDPKHVVFEITESNIIDDLEEAIIVLNRIKNLGVNISLDDFGTGYSSLTYLQKLPIDILKIDRRFISDCSRDEFCSPILKFVINLAHSMKMQVVAEGIEDKIQSDTLTKLKADYLQGYYFAKPSLAKDIDAKIFKK